MVSDRMTDLRSCPLCAETYDENTDLRVHLEVEHRKSELVACLVDREATVTELSSEREPTTVDEERPAPSA